MNGVTSYQRRKKEIASLKRSLNRANEKISMLFKANWDAREQTGERLGISPFAAMEGNEEYPDMALDPRMFAGYLLEIIRGLPLP